MRIPALAATLAVFGVAACTTGPVGQATMANGVGFGDYQRYLRQQDSGARRSAAPYSVPPESRAAPILPPNSMPAQAPSTLDAVPVRTATAHPAPVTTSVPAQQTARVGAPMQTIASHPLAAPAAQSARQQRPAQVQPAATAARPVATASVGTARTVQAGASFGTTPSFDAGPSVRPGISDEQDFEAVSSRETIESDRERIQRNRAQYQVVEVTSVPDASVSGGPNIIQYALATQHAPGTRMHRRINPLRWSRWENACLQFRNQDAAQEAFLARGGPQRDPDNLDPDGDGYACWWDPTPVRSAMAHSN